MTHAEFAIVLECYSGHFASYANNTTSEVATGDITNNRTKTKLLHRHTPVCRKTQRWEPRWRRKLRRLYISTCSHNSVAKTSLAYLTTVRDHDVCERANCSPIFEWHPPRLSIYQQVSKRVYEEKEEESFEIHVCWYEHVVHFGRAPYQPPHQSESL